MDTLRSEVKRQQKCGLASGVNEKTGEQTAEGVAPEKESQQLNCSTNQVSNSDNSKAAEDDFKSFCENQKTY